MSGRMKAISTGWGFLGLLLAIGMPASAQSVIGVSEILSSTNSSEIDTYSATEIDYQTSLYYGAYVEGYLYQNGTLIAAGSASDPSDAYGYMSKPLQVPDEYELESDHYLVATYVYEYYDGTTYWSNPDYYLIGTGDSTDPSGSNFAPGGGPAYYDTQYFYLGTTAVVMSSAGPTITSISPAAGTVGTSGSITVYGDNLVDIFTGQASASITGSGVTLSVNGASAARVTLNYSIATNAGTGNHNITLSTRFGTSNPAGFNVGDPTPVINSISPDTWQAGAGVQITIIGQHFGTNPSLTITGPGVAGSSIVSAGDTQIVANVTISISSPGGTATIQVQSNGYGGSGFLGTNPGQSSQTSNTANIQPVDPAPQILFNGNNVSGTAQSVVVGQQIALSIGGLPSGLSIQSGTWSGVNAGAAVGGWTPGQPPDALAPNNTGFKFYWIDSGTSGQASYTVTYAWTLSNGQSNSASVIFNAVGPTNATISPTMGNMQLESIIINSDGSQQIGPGGAPTLLLFGVPLSPIADGEVGIKFLASAQLPANNVGAYVWVQVLNNDQYAVRTSSGPQTCTAVSAGPILDNTYPYGTEGQNLFTTAVQGDTATDNPNASLNQSTGELSRHFSATMYAMWLPNAASGCTGSACTIPVPLGHLDWQLEGDTINTLMPQSNDTDWIMNCQSATQNGFTPDDVVYPKWTGTFTNGTVQCH